MCKCRIQECELYDIYIYRKLNKFDSFLLWKWRIKFDCLLAFKNIRNIG